MQWPCSVRLRLIAAVFLAVSLAWIVIRSTASSRSTSPSALLPIRKTTRERVIAVFVDSLSDRVAEDPRVMPELSALARRGASFTVEPCRDRLTYLCLRAVLTGSDESSLVALRDNFDKKRRENRESLLSEVARAGGTTAVVGSNDFDPYGASLTWSSTVPLAQESRAQIVRRFRELEGQHRPDLMLVGLASGDLAAHAHGTNSAEYRARFGEIDAIIGDIFRARDPSTHFVVFGDHGHDTAGRHLPGGPATTWAVYVGPAFPPGLHQSLALTDHRALLGLLAGVPTPKVYAAPHLERLLVPAWVKRQFEGGLPSLAPEVALREEPPLTSMRALAIFMVGALGLALAFESVASLAVASVGAVLVAAIAITLGANYDQVRLAIHDQGFTPERGLYLLIPLGVGYLAAVALRRLRVLRAAQPGAWLPTGAAATLVAVFLFLFPSANFYGSARAIVYAALVTIVALVIDAWKHELPSAEARRWLIAASSLAVLTLASYARVARSEGAAEAAVYVLEAAIYKGQAWLPLVVGKACVFGVFSARRCRPRSFDGALGASLLTASLLVQLAGAHLSHVVYAVLFAVLCVSHGWGRRRAPLSQLCAWLLLLNCFYGNSPQHLAPIELLLGATAATLAGLRNIRMRRDSFVVASGLTVLTAAYLLLWPMLGFRLSGLDFSFAFEWLPNERYEELWWVIAASALLKLAAPYWILCSIVDCEALPRESGSLAALLFSAKVGTLSLMIAAYAAGHAMKSNLAMDMLAELVLVTLVLIFVSPFWIARGKADGA